MTLRNHSKNQHLPRSLKILFGGGWPLTGAIVVAILIPNSNIFPFTPWFALGLAVVSLVSVEQLYRYAAANDRQIKLLCMNLGAIFIYDVYLYAHALIFQGLDPLLWQSRAAVSIATCLFMAIGGLVPLQQSQRTANFNISRPIAFYTTSLIGVGLLITSLSLGGYYVRLYGGNWGTVIYSFILVAAVLFIATVFISSSLRSRLSVLINKHLFRHKYDYRSEWLRIINYLAQPAESTEVNQRAFFAVASTTKAPGGAIWLLKQAFTSRFIRSIYRGWPIYKKNLQIAISAMRSSNTSGFISPIVAITKR